ncbi:hypothetical protein NDN08_002166 [Rhodosorus marinus]|uniref:Uncharacterized protein n=1 Tax=Rhodosorus marinus TaxID=101924 RepID=A0AAV8USY1_9RHOD|nr:hypothetical protein NDN08_002166 [Rhodosorus marinus]
MISSLWRLQRPCGRFFEIPLPLGELVTYCSSCLSLTALLQVLPARCRGIATCQAQSAGHKEPVNFGEDQKAGPNKPPRNGQRTGGQPALLVGVKNIRLGEVCRESENLVNCI